MNEVPQVGSDNLTDRQREILAFVRGYWSENGYGPRLQDIADRFGFASRNGVVGHLRLMAKKGVVEVLPHDRGVYPVGLRLRISAAAKLAAAN